MIDLGISKIALIGAVALIVIGPEKLPRVARTVGALLGKAQRYVADVKAEVNRSMDLEELKKMKDTVESAARGNRLDANRYALGGGAVQPNFRWRGRAFASLGAFKAATGQDRRSTLAAPA